MAKIAIGMSGGVDSSVAAALLKENGHAVIGIMMRIWGGDSLIADHKHHGCYGPEEETDIEDARKVAGKVDIPFYVFDLREEYRTEVLDYLSDEYLAGRTPNPCVKCNRRIKFEMLAKKAQQSGLDFDYFATGHYARLEYDEESQRYLLKKASDISKDQSYFLYSLSQEQLGRAIFPLGDYTKKEIRQMAFDYGLDIGDKPDSQNFISGDYSCLIEEKAKPGPVFDTQGNTVGQHKGIAYYTVGQRRGLGIAAKEPLYVTTIDAERNSIIVGTKYEIYESELTASELNWISVERLRQPIEAKVKIRYMHKEAEAVISPLDENTCHVQFHKPQMAITPGQAVVFYNGDIVLGGGTILEKSKANNANSLLEI
jgi:tRNA-specific 2-thiouridylase